MTDIKWEATNTSPKSCISEKVCLSAHDIPSRRLSHLLPTGPVDDVLLVGNSLHLARDRVFNGIIFNIYISSCNVIELY